MRRSSGFWLNIQAPRLCSRRRRQSRNPRGRTAWSVKLRWSRLEMPGGVPRRACLSRLTTQGQAWT